MNWLIGVAIALVAAALVAFNALFVVGQTEQAIVVQFGNPVRTITEPGLYAKMPFVQNVISLDKRILQLDGKSGTVLTVDRTAVVVDAFAKYRISNPLQFYRAVRGDQEVARQRLTPILNASLRRVLGEQRFAALLSDERIQLMRAIREGVVPDAKELGIDIVDVRIRRSDLPKENQSAVFERMKTERQRIAEGTRAVGDQKAQEIRSAADRKVTEIKADAQRKSEILRGEGEGERNRILSEAYGKDAEFFSFYRSLQAYEEALAGQNTTMVLSPNSPFFRYFERGQSGGAR